MKRILAVDDDLDIQKLLKVFLKNKYELELSINGAEALKRLQNESLPLPDLILLDIEMPVMSGIELRRKLYENPRLKDLPIIFLSANIQYSSQVEHVNDFDFLNKPIEKEDLLNIIDTFFQHQKT